LRYAFVVRLRRPFFPPVVLLAVLVLSMGLAGCESSGVSRTVQIGERPTWNAGDSWTYRGRGPSGTFNVTRKVLREGVFEGREAYEVDAGGTHYWYTKQLGYLARTKGDETTRLARPPEDWQWPIQVGKQWSAIVAWIDQVTREPAGVTDELLTRTLERVREDQLVELTVLAGAITMLNQYCTAFDIPPSA